MQCSWVRRSTGSTAIGRSRRFTACSGPGAAWRSCSVTATGAICPGTTRWTPASIRSDRPHVRPENRPWTGLWRVPFERTELFSPLEVREFPMVLTFTVEEFQLMVSTWSFVAALPEHDRESLLDDLGGIIHAHDIHRFDLRGSVTVHLTTKRE